MTLQKFEDYVKQGIVNKISANPNRAKSLFLESERKIRALNERITKIGVTDENANDYIEYSYDTLMLLVRAKLFIDGYTANGKGAHGAEVSYLDRLGLSDTEVRFMDKLRYYRNGILYYGTALDKEYAEKVINFTKKIQPILKEITEKSF